VPKGRAAKRGHPTQVSKIAQTLSTILGDHLGMQDPNITHPVSCDRVEGGLLFHYADGASKLIPNWTPPPGWSKRPELVLHEENPVFINRVR
jgi:hypothetical protein